jgi:hypothetical protein
MVSSRLVLFCGIAIFSVFPLLALDNQASVPKDSSVSTSPAKANSQNATVIEEGDLVEEPQPAVDSAARKAPADTAAQSKAAKKSTPPAAVQGTDSSLFIGEGEEDIFTAKPKALPVTKDSTANASGQPAVNQPQQESQEQMERSGRYHGGHFSRPSMPPEENAPPTENAGMEPQKRDSTVKDSVREKKPAKVENVRSINFAKNLKEYRSPKRALFMSLILPGLGQAYARNYWKSAIFGAVEVALITLGIKFAVDGNTKKREAHQFADKHFNIDDFWTYYASLRTHIMKDTNHAKDIVNIMNSIYSDTLIREAAAAHDNSYYQYLREKSFSQGWDDCEPVLDTNGSFQLTNSGYTYQYQPIKPDTTWLFYPILPNSTDTKVDVWGDNTFWVYGYSKNQLSFRTLDDEANKYFDYSRTVVLVLLVNHVVSAVDALITAKRHNDNMLGKQGFWKRVDLNQSYAFSQKGLVTQVGVRVRF